MECTEIRLAALMHDVDDHKYFKSNLFTSSPSSRGTRKNDGSSYDDDADIEQSLRGSFPNAIELLEATHVPSSSIDRILYNRFSGLLKKWKLISIRFKKNESWHLLIPRWSDCLEAVDKVGVVRCYRYNLEKGMPLYNEECSPKPQSKEDVWSHATVERFDHYISSGGKGTSNDMISHYYDKLLHIAKPPKEIVQNDYLETAAEESSKELVEICLRYGLTGKVDVEYILALEQSLLE